MVLQPRALLLGSPGLGSSEFARHYFRNHGCFLLLRVLRWFTSPGLLQHPMYSDGGNGCSHPLGFPIRKSPDHSLLAAPRSLSQLTTSFFAYLRQGIHTHALSSLTITSTSHTRCTLLLRAYLCLYARQYSVVKDLDRLGDPYGPDFLRTLPNADWWAWVESNHRPHPYQGCALAN